MFAGRKMKSGDIIGEEASRVSGAMGMTRSVRATSDHESYSKTKPLRHIERKRVADFVALPGRHDRLKAL